MNPCHTWKLYCSQLKIFIELGDSQNKLSHPFKKRILTSQKEINNKIHTASVDQYCGAFSNSDWSDILTQGRTTCKDTPRKISIWSKGWIENYDCCRKTGQLRTLRQNPNLIVFSLPESYHSLSLQDDSSSNYQQVWWTIPYPLVSSIRVLFLHAIACNNIVWI